MSHRSKSTHAARKPSAIKSIQLLALCGLLSAPCAHAAITVAITSGSAAQDTVQISSDAADSISVSCLNNLFAVNGVAVLGATLACNEKANLIVQGGPLSNLIDLSGITAAAFGANLRIIAFGGGAVDILIGSPLADDLSGGVGNDSITGGAGDDVMRWLPGDGNDTLDGLEGVDRLDFVGSGAAEAFRLALIQPAFPGPDSALRLTRDVGNIVMDMSRVEEVLVDGVSGIDRAVIEDVSLEVTQVKLNFGPGTGPNTVVAAGTNGVNNFSMSEPVAGTVAITGASVAISMTGLKPADSIVLTGFAGADQFLVPDSLSERFALTLVGGDGIDGARAFGDARDEQYRFSESQGLVILNRAAPISRTVNFLAIEAIELDTGGGVDQVSAPPLPSTALVLAGGAPSGPRDDVLMVQNFAGATDVSPINQADAQPIIFSGFERTNDYIVQTLGDSDFASLRDRVSDAVLRAGRFVTFEPNLTGTIALATPISLSGSVNIIGPGANVLELRPSVFAGIFINTPGSNAFISGLAIRGQQGGPFPTIAINNQGTLNMTGMHLSNNALRTIVNTGELTLRNSAITNNANISGVSPIENSGTLRLINTTLSANSTVGPGQGVIRNDASGLLSLINCTYAKNTSSFSNNNSGLVNNGSALLINTIISENSGTAISGNLAAAGSSNNLIGANAIVLGDLQNNGGTTPTLAIAANSSAHNTGSNAAVNIANFGAAPFTDQRGAPFVRINDTNVDIGAFELQPPLEAIFRSGFE